MSTAPLLLTVPDACRALAIGKTSIYELIWAGELHPVRIGRSVRFTVAELERFIASKQDPPSSDAPQSTTG